MTFSVSSIGQVDFVRLHIGTVPGLYNLTIDLRSYQINGSTIVATDAGLANILSQPGTYYAALTAVDLNGLESRFSNELRVDRF